MGKLLKKLGKYKDVVVELNDENVVHIETDTFRIELTEEEFRNIAASVIIAGFKLSSSK